MHIVIEGIKEFVYLALLSPFLRCVSEALQENQRQHSRTDRCNRYSDFTSEEIREIGVQDIRSNSEIQAHDVANNIRNNIEAVHSNLAFLSSIPAIRNQDLEGSKKLFSDAQENTINITSSYFWIDKDGKLLG